jgi:hypothetical protein
MPRNSSCAPNTLFTKSIIASACGTITYGVMVRKPARIALIPALLSKSSFRLHDNLIQLRWAAFDQKTLFLGCSAKLPSIYLTAASPKKSRAFYAFCGAGCQPAG